SANGSASPGGTRWPPSRPGSSGCPRRRRSPRSRPGSRPSISLSSRAPQGWLLVQSAYRASLTEVCRLAAGQTMSNLANMLSAAARQNGEGVALRLDDVAVPYSAFEAARARIAGLLAAAGIEAGDRVGAMLPNV